MRRTMIDIETLDTDVDTSVVLSIGLLNFDMAGPIGVGLTIYPSVTEQLALGRTVSLDTVRFWCTQDGSAAAADEAMVPESRRESVREAWLSFRAFFRTEGDEDQEVWANGDLFDIGLLTSLFRPHAMPWRYNAVRDLRTVLWEATPLGFVRQTVDDARRGPVHSAIGDCHHQVQLLLAVRRFYEALVKGS